MIRTISLTLLLLVLLSSCKKDQDNDAIPTLVFNSPADGASYNVLDTIPVDLDVNDDKELASISVQLADAQLTPQLPAFTQTISGRSAHLQYSYPINDIHLQTGDYVFIVTLTDAHSNVGHFYRHIYLTAVPLAHKGYFFTTTPAANTTDLIKVDSANNMSTVATYSGDFTGMAVSNRWQQAYVCGRSTGAFHAYSIDGAHAGWTENPVVSSAPFFTGVQTSKDLVHVSYFDGAVRGYDGTHMLRNITNTGTGFHPVKTFFADYRLYAEVEDVTGTNRKFAVYSSAGGGIQECLLQGNIVDIARKDSLTLVVAANFNNQGKLYLYDFTTNGFWEPISLPAGETVKSMTQADANTYLVAMSSGTIYKFTYSPIGLLSVVTGTTAQKIRFDELSSEIIVAEGNNLRRYAYPGGNLLGTICTAGSAITDFAIWYNR